MKRSDVPDRGLTRRALLGGAAALAALGALDGSARAAEPPPGPAAPDRWSGYRRAVVFDGLSGIDLGGRTAAGATGSSPTSCWRRSTAAA